MWPQNGDRSLAQPIRALSGRSQRERARFPQYWPIRANSRRAAVNQKDARLELRISGSANRIRTTDLLVNNHRLHSLCPKRLPRPLEQRRTVEEVALSERCWQTPRWPVQEHTFLRRVVQGEPGHSSA